MSGFSATAGHSRAAPACAHCGVPLPSSDATGEPAFCCAGCAGAYRLVSGLGLGAYYRRRRLDPAAPSLRPDPDGPPIDYTIYAHPEAAGEYGLLLAVEGIHCAACAWLIESVLGRQPGVVAARLNLTTRRLTLRWRGGAGDADALVAPVAVLGYRLVPFDPALIDREGARRDRELLRALAVAGFAAGNIMLLSVAVWAGHAQGMGPATRDLFHWLSALIALPVIAYAGRPFFRSGLAALRAGRTNMDVPISIAVVLTGAISLWETATGGQHAYFNSAVALLFFLLVGRYLDQRARSRARGGAERLLALQVAAVTVLDADGVRRLLPPSQVRSGMIVLAVSGERIVVDGTVIDGDGALDASLITGESLPAPVGPGGRVFAGTLNVGGPLRIRASGVGEGTLLAEIVRLVEAATAARGRFVALADRVARLYAPFVHTLALTTFLGWTIGWGLAWQPALLIAASVLIITCPCALALAVPAVQVVATGRLLRQGILAKSGTALERLAAIDTVVFDKTGTLTIGRPELVDAAAIPPDDRAFAASMAAASRHPLARALVRGSPSAPALARVREEPGWGLAAMLADGEARLGSRRWCGIADDAAPHGDAWAELWLVRPGRPPRRFAFADRLRDDAAAVVAALRRAGSRVMLMSGDREVAVAAAARDAGIDSWEAGLDPGAKRDRLEALARAGQRVLMVGDGLNDAPALAAAAASMSPSTAADISQTLADLVFQGQRLGAVVEVLGVARRARRLVVQNLALTFLYNALTIPLAVTGWVTPLVAAIAMSTSSLVVIGNALRLHRR